MNDVKRALSRKFGPLPAWAWAAIAGGALYFYRRSKSGAGALGAANVPATSSPDVTDQTTAGLQPPVPLDPGQSVYDPNAQQLFTPPLGLGDTTPVDAGANGDGSPPAPSTTPAAAGKRKPKAKPKHAKPAGRSLRDRARAGVHKVRAAKPAKGHPVSKPKASRLRSVRRSATPQRGRATPPPRVALRQRPTAPRVVNHAEQKVSPNPGHPPKGAARAAAAKPAKGRRK